MKIQKTVLPILLIVIAIAVLASIIPGAPSGYFITSNAPWGAVAVVAVVIAIWYQGRK